MTQAEMAESLEIQPISLVRLIDRLCDNKLVERRPHPSDRRANRLYLTPKGRATLARLVPLGRRDLRRRAGFLQRDRGRRAAGAAAAHQEQHSQVHGRQRCQTSRRRGPSCWLSRHVPRVRQPMLVPAVVARSKLHALVAFNPTERLVDKQVQPPPAGLGAHRHGQAAAAAHRRCWCWCRRSSQWWPWPSISSAAATSPPTTPTSARRRC